MPFLFEESVTPTFVCGPRKVKNILLFNTTDVLFFKWLASYFVQVAASSWFWVSSKKMTNVFCTHPPTRGKKESQGRRVQFVGTWNEVVLMWMRTIKSCDCLIINGLRGFTFVSKKKNEKPSSQSMNIYRIWTLRRFLITFCASINNHW